MMRRAFFLACFLAVAAANPQYYSSSGNRGIQNQAISDIQNLFRGSSSSSGSVSGCDPATGFGCGGRSLQGTSGYGGSVDCPQDRVVTVPRVSTSVQQVVRTVAVPQENTQFVTQISLVPSFSTSTVVSTDIDTRIQYRTRVETNYDTQRIASTVRLPDQTNTRFQTSYRTEVDTRYQTQTRYVTRQEVRTSVSVINTRRQVESVVQVPQLQVSTRVVQVPGPARTQVQTEFTTREVVSYYQPQPQTVVQTSVSYRTEVVSQPVRQPDTYVTVTSVQVVPVTSVIINTRVVPQYVTVTRTDARTFTRTQATTEIVPVRSTNVQVVYRTNFQTDFVTNTNQVVRTEVQQQVQTVRVPGQPRVVYRTEQVQVTRTVPGADTYQTRIVTVPRQREVYNTRVVQRVVNQERVVKQTRGVGYCKGGYSHGYGGYRRY